MLGTFPYTSWMKTYIYNLDLKFGSTEWVRLSETYPDNTLFGSNPSWNDIRQGKIGNCYMFSGITALAEFPSLLENVFLNDIN
jgi:hypothetical protein